MDDMKKVQTKAKGNDSHKAYFRPDKGNNIDSYHKMIARVAETGM